MYAQIAFNTLTSKSSLARPNFSTSEKIILVDCSVLLIIVVQTLQFDKHKTNDVLFLYVGREICKNKEMAWRHFGYSCYPYNAKPISCQRLPEKGQGILKMKSVSFYKTLLKDKSFKLCLWMSKNTRLQGARFQPYEIQYWKYYFWCHFPTWERPVLEQSLARVRVLDYC